MKTDTCHLIVFIEFLKSLETRYLSCWKTNNENRQLVLSRRIVTLVQYSWYESLDISLFWTSLQLQDVNNLLWVLFHDEIYKNFWSQTITWIFGNHVRICWITWRFNLIKTFFNFCYSPIFNKFFLLF